MLESDRMGLEGLARSLGLTAALGLCSCNVLTGADDVRIYGQSAEDGSSQPELLVAGGITLDGISINQGSRYFLLQDHEPATEPFPIVAGRDAQLRIFYTADDTYYEQPTTVLRLTLGEKEPLDTEVSPIPNSSSLEDNLTSTLYLHLPGSALEDVSSFQVELLQWSDQTTGDNEAAAYPAEGQADLGLTPPEAARLKVVLVPITYKADGSDRLPDVSTPQQQLYHDMLYRAYPTAEVELAVKQPGFEWDQPVSPMGDGWPELLEAVAAYRQQQGAAPDEYYYGVFSPAEDLMDYCTGGCGVAGLGYLLDTVNPYHQVAIGLGFTGEDYAWTAVHELGHTHGRPHAPCGSPDTVDPLFPYPDGGIGVAGYDVIDGTRVPVDGRFDFMSYCQPVWVSDYTFTRLAERMSLVSGALLHVPAELVDRTYPRISLRPDGTPVWAEPLELHQGPLGPPQNATLTLQSGAVQVVQGWFFGYDHLPGGTLLLDPEEDIPTAALSAVSVVEQRAQ